MLIAYVGWRGGFMALAALTAVCLIVVATLLPREKQFVRASNLAASLRQMVAHLRNPKLLATYAVGFGVLFNFIAVFTYMSFHLAGPPFFQSAAFIGSIFVVYLAGAAAAALTGRMIAAIGRRTFVLWVLAAWACGILLMLIPSVPVIVLALAIASICGMLAQAASTSYVAITAQGGTSSAVGLYVTSFYVGGTFGGWLAGLAYEAGGWPATLVLVLGMQAIMATIVATTLEPDLGRYWLSRCETCFTGGRAGGGVVSADCSTKPPEVRAAVCIGVKDAIGTFGSSSSRS